MLAADWRNEHRQPLNQTVGQTLERLKMEGQKYSVSYRTPPGAPPQAFTYAREATHREAGNKLFDILWKTRLPAVVDLREETREVSDDPYIMIDNEYRIEITVNPVQWHHFTMASFPDFGSAQQSVHLTALREQLAYMTFGFISLLMIILWIIGGR